MSGKVGPIYDYNTVKIGTQEWTVKNLDIIRYRNGDIIPQVNSSNWNATNTGAYRDTVYGKLYNWYAVNDPRGFAPIGYRVPTKDDWDILISYLGGSTLAGGTMKEIGTTHWYSPNTGATNSSGFTGLPGGNINSNDGNLYGINIEGYWWSSTLNYGTYGLPYAYELTYNLSDISTYIGFEKNGYSVRLIKD
jgi:uncharacterized protein (TIGR02145 family)